MLEKIIVNCPAKINLFLDVLEEREDGYHDIKTVMQSVSIYDKIIIKRNKLFKIRVYSEQNNIPLGPQNSAHKAVEAFFKAINMPVQGCDILICKEIPLMAGMAGGSADAAGTLLALNQLYNANLSIEKLCEIGKKVGADVPFCIMGGTAICEGIGDILTPIETNLNYKIVVAQPQVRISTFSAYQEMSGFGYFSKGDFDSFMKAYQSKDLFELSGSLFNVFEKVIQDVEINEIKESMYIDGALGVLMTGSGSCVYGLFLDTKNAEKAVKSLKQRFSYAIICEPIPNGPTIEVQKVNIREENPADYENVYSVVKNAFSSAEQSDSTEQDLVNALRKSDAFIPELSIIAENGDRIIGYILFTKVKIGESTQLALAPLAVSPEYQKMGVGKLLIEYGHQKAKQLGYTRIVVLGSENYYPKFGYKMAKEFDIFPPVKFPEKNFMVAKIGENETSVKGVVRYSPEFKI